MTVTEQVAVMQPTYLPWLGYFDLMDQVDCFVLLDNVQFERHSWQQRNRIKTAQGESMLVVPVKRTGLETPIRLAEIADPGQLQKHVTTIRQAYARAPHIAALDAEFIEMYENPGPLLADFLIHLVQWLGKRLGIGTPVVRASDLEVHGRRDELVRAICDRLGATRYLATAGSHGYMQRGTAFDDGLVSVSYHQYVCQPYAQQHGGFIPYLSSIDAILNLGDDARKAMVAGRRDAATA